jgi:hypothetical protein
MPFTAPAAHIGVTRLFGVSLPSGSEAQDSSQTRTLKTYPLPGANGEVVRFFPAKQIEKKVAVNYIGAASITEVTVAQDLDPTTIKITEASSDEKNEGLPTMTLSASGSEAFTDGSGDQIGTGADEPSAATLNLRSISIALGQSVKRSVKIKDVRVVGGDGVDAWRGTCTKMLDFSVDFKGDLPAGIALGTEGAGVYGISNTGVTLLTEIVEKDMHDDVNSGSYKGENAPSATY